MKLNLKKYKCNGCYEILGPFNEKIIQCDFCGSSLLEKQDVSAQDYILFAQGELENANHHNYIELPNKLLDSILGSLNLSKEDQLELARILAQEFYNNI